MPFPAGRRQRQQGALDGVDLQTEESNIHSDAVDAGRLFVVVSGLPASGKTTLGRALSESLGLPFLDKDDILEALFEVLEVRSRDDRSQLSRASDAVLESVALASQGAVVTSFWRRPSLSTTSGTPTEWLSSLKSDVVVEVLCNCDPALAASRFANRKRHPSHLDGGSTERDLRSAFTRLAQEGPVLAATPVIVDTSETVDPEGVAAVVRDAATRQGWCASD